MVKYVGDNKIVAREVKQPTTVIKSEKSPIKGKPKTKEVEIRQVAKEEHKEVMNKQEVKDTKQKPGKFIE